MEVCPILPLLAGACRDRQLAEFATCLIERKKTN
jgi:hypothetical protein